MKKNATAAERRHPSGMKKKFYVKPEPEGR
jgi:hypothetical protein